MANDVRVRASVVDGVSGPLARIGDKLKTTFGDKATRNLFAANVASAAFTKGLGLVGQAVGNVTDFLGDATRAAIEEEQSVSRLDASLRANVKGWDGNRDAIESVLKARMALGFSDDEQRDSLALITVATKDAAKALDVQRAAMDLARLKGIDLRTASEALIKVEGGQFRALKALGIQLRDGATATEALAAVQEAARGQAEAFANTSGGKLLTAQTKLGEAMERIGGVILPLVADGADLLGDALDGLVGNTVDATISLAQMERELAGDKNAGSAFLDVVADLTGLQSDARKAALAYAAAGIDVRAAMESQTTKTYDALEAARALRFVEQDTSDATDDLTDDTDDLTSAFERVQDAAKDAEEAFDDYSSSLFDADIVTGDLAEAKRELDELLKDGPETKAAADMDIYRGKVAEAEKAIADLERQKAALAGDESLYAWLQTQQAGLADMTTAAQAAYWAMRAITLKSLTTAPIEFVNDYMDRIDNLLAPGEARAHGGPVKAGEPYVVGEEGPELFVPSRSGTIVPNGGSRGGSWGGGEGGTQVIQLVVSGRELARVVLEEADYRRSSGTFLPS